MSIEKKLLYIEDDPGSRKVMRFLVSRLEGAVQLDIFEDSQDFLERLEALAPPPDAFFLDIHVSPHDGFKMLEMLRAHERYAQKIVIALTASVMNEEINKLKEAGFDGVLAKPLSFHTFPDTLDRILAGEKIWIVKR
jgi:CheY-like chemotaxis protein